MAITETNAPVYSTITQAQKEKLIKLAAQNHRSLSGEVAHAITLYLAQHEEEHPLKSGDPKQ